MVCCNLSQIFFVQPFLKSYKIQVPSTFEPGLKQQCATCDTYRYDVLVL